MQNTIDGITYESRPEYNGCEGCEGRVADDTGLLCHRLRQANGNANYCIEHSVIWVEKVSPFTMRDTPHPNTQEIATSHGTLQRAAVEGQEVCEGCIAQHNRELCREINVTAQPCYLSGTNTIWIKSQPAVPDYSEVLCILQEEAAEVIAATSKVRRFGLEANHPDRTTTNKQELEEEVGDLLAMIQILVEHNYLDQANIALATQNKIVKLKQYSTVWKQNKHNN